MTLLELLTVMALMLLVTTAAVPTVQNTLPALRLRGASDQLVQDLALARLRAIERRQSVSVTLDEDGSGYAVNPGLRRPFPSQTSAIKFPTVTFDRRGFLEPPTPVTIEIGGTSGTHTLIVAAAGRIRRKD